MDEGIRKLQRSDEPSRMESVALRVLRKMYHEYLRSARYEITGDILIKAQDTLYGAVTWTVDGLVPSFTFPARFIISAAMIEVRMADRQEAQQIRAYREEIWPKISRLVVLWMPDLKLSVPYA